MKLKAIIFDLDGVLTFTDHYHYLAWKAIADQEGVPFSEKDNDRLRGVSRMASLELILEKASRVYTLEEKEKLAEMKNERYRNYLKEMTPQDVSSDVRETLRVLRERGVKLAVGSASKNTAYILERTGLTDAFDAIADGTMVKKSKPDPEVFLLAAELLGVSPAEAAVVEDAKAGIEAAKSGGFFAFGIGDASSCPLTDRPIASLLDLLKE